MCDMNGRHQSIDHDQDLESKFKELSLMKKQKRQAQAAATTAAALPAVRVPSAVSEQEATEARRRTNSLREEDRVRTVAAMSEHYKDILDLVGEDSSREGLLKTPERAAKALMYFTKGYEEKITGKGIHCFNSAGMDG
jgi:GTP cyclohydrolase I